MLRHFARARAGLPALLAVGLLVLPARSAEAPLAARIEAALQRLGPHGVTAARVVAVDRGEVLYERNPDLSLNPASNMKLLTSAAALARLGADYRFRTRVLATVSPDRRGRLSGRLILAGGGDPVLETPHLEALADAVRAAGIREVREGLQVDDYRYDDERLGNGWNWDDEPFYYSAQISALSVDRNVLRVDVAPGKRVGDAPVVRVHPVEGYARVERDAVTTAAGSMARLRISRGRGKSEVRVRGGIALDAPGLKDQRVTVEEPALYAGFLFRKLLQDRGVRVRGQIRRGAVPREALELAAHQSPPLSEITALLNKPSDNLVAEMLLKELGYTCGGSGDAIRGSEIVEAWLKEIGISTAGVRVNDGSGLSRLDLVTARAISDLLLYAHRQPWREVFVASLPIAGVDGTLRSRLKGTRAEGNARAKTGTLSHVTALGGYVNTAAGERLVFSILVNNFPGPVSGSGGAKRAEDEIVAALAEAAPGTVGAASGAVGTASGAPSGKAP